MNGVDRQRLLEFADAATIAPRAIRRDGCGCWLVEGKQGVVYTSGSEAFLLVCGLHEARTARWWEAVKRRLADFTTVSQDGDAEGVLRMIGLPTKLQGAAIKKVLVMPKRRFVSDERRTEMVARLQPFQKQPGRRDQVLEMMRQPGGASADDIATATGLKVHSVRAVISGLRGAGVVVERKGSQYAA